MKTLYKSVWLFLLIHFIEAGCCVIDTCGGCSENTSGASRYRINGYKIKTEVNGNVVATNAIISVKSLRIIVDPEEEYIAGPVPEHSFKALLACSPLEPAPTQTITSLNIYSNADFELGNRTITTGESLNELFSLANGIYGEGRLTDFLNTSAPDASHYEYMFQITESITKNQIHKFTVAITLNDNQSFELKTPAIELTP